jgi:hypothetical protein
VRLSPTHRTARGESAYLRRLSDYVWWSGKSVRFSLDGTNLGTGVTDANGMAAYLYTAPTAMTTGNHDMLGEFAGDSHYLPNAGTAVLTVTP